MSVIVSFGDSTAKVERYRWESEDSALEEMLNAFVPQYGPTGVDPYPDHTLATRCAELFDGKITHVDDPSPRVPSVLY